MSGLPDYVAESLLNWETGGVAFPALPAVYLGLLTTAPTADTPSGYVEVSGTGYARPQIAGSAVTNAATAGGSAVLHFASTPSWLVAGMYARDLSASGVIPANTTILSTTTTTVTLSNNVTGGGVNNGDSIGFTAFSPAVASSGSAPSITPANTNNNALITFAAAGASWGTAVAFGLFDALTGGDMLNWDYLGTYAWLPATITAASPGVITAHAHGYNAADNVVVSAKFGGTLPTFSQSNLTGTLAVVSPTTDTFTVTNGGVAVNTSTTGDFLVRKIAPQQIPQGIITQFAAGQLQLYAA